MKQPKCVKNLDKDGATYKTTWNSLLAKQRQSLADLVGIKC